MENPDAPRADIQLRILHTSDLHGTLRGYDYLADKTSKTFGLCRTATLIRAARAEAENTMLFDTGDVLQGSAICDLSAERGLAPGQRHPMIQAMNALGYDAATPGNHDFNFGAEFLFRAYDDAAFPLVSANFLRRGAVSSNATVFAPFTILSRDVVDMAGNRHVLRVAVIGCLPPQTIDWDHALSGDFATSCMVSATRRALASVRAAGCDLTILLAHSGIDPDAPKHCAENALIDLAALDGLDLILGGHTHRTFPANHGNSPAHPAIERSAGTIHGTPVLLSGFGGNHLGQVDLTLSPGGTGRRWRVSRCESSLKPLAHRDACGQVVETTPEDSALLALTEPTHTETLAYIRQPLGETRQPLHSFFSLLANDASVQLVAQAQASFLRRALAKTPLSDLPLLSAAAPFKTGRVGGPEHYTHIPAGPLSRRSITDLYLYPNTICAVKLTGAQLRDWLEHSASLFSHIPAGAASDISLLDDSFPGYKFDVICGLTYQIDLTQPPRYDCHNRIADSEAHRIRALTYKNAPVQDDQTFLVATNSYRVYGTGFAGHRPEIVFESPTANRDIVLGHIRDKTPLEIVARQVWSFSPLHGATAIFETSPLARAYLGDPLLPMLEDLGNTPEGFARFRITL